MTTAATVSIRAVRPVLGGLLAVGADTEAVLAAVGIEASILDDVDARIPHVQAAALWDEAVRQTGNEGFGLRVAQAMELSGFDVLGYILMACPSLRDSFERLIRFHRLNHDAVELRLERSAAGFVLSHRLPGARVVSRSIAEFVLGGWLSAGRSTTRVQWDPLEVRFMHGAPDDTSELTKFFRCPLRFESDQNALVIAEATLSLPNAEANPGLLGVLERHGKELLERLPRGSTLTDRVREVLAGELRGGNPSAEHVAERLGMSVRTLARRLAEEDTSHKVLLEELRRELALRYLSQPDLATGEVAFLLGFSEASAFHRAFKRWTGSTPGAYRAQSSAN